MNFENIVSVKESFCCDSCKSYEYDLPCQVDSKLLEYIYNFVNNDNKNINFNDLLNSKMLLQIIKNDTTKVELKPNSRYIKICSPPDLTFKQDIDGLLSKWIEDKLNIKLNNIR